MTRHVHADVIHAWAEGETIQYRANGEWVDFCEENRSPNFLIECLYRVKPKLVKKEGWVNVYDCGPSWVAHCSPVFRTKEDADKARFRDMPPKDCVRIEWEEEE